ncbi:PQQ-binding-like beta-propeller repeat protein [Streptomyces sp. NPDC004134]|uniref:outer membrane protein assembly factor BamB family protein n=1 Tax=Streptomyces sp. NPDC004134 TaxID=3364691 RepID=UPI0036AEC1DE
MANLRRLWLKNRAVDAGCAALGFTLLLGCTATDEDAGSSRKDPAASPKPSDTAPPAPPRAYDRVTKFSAEETVLPGGLSRTTLDGTTAWITGPSDLKVVDLTTEESTVIRPKGQPPAISPHFGRPVLTEVQGKRVAVAVLPVSTPGSGTHNDKAAVEMLVVDARTHKTIWSAEIADAGAGFSEDDAGAVLGADDGIAIVDDGWAIRAVDLATRKTVWKTDGETQEVVAVGEGIVALTKTEDWGEVLHGLRVRDGKRAWTSGEPEDSLHVSQLGPGRLLITRGADTAYDGGRVVGLADGRQVASPEIYAVPDRCVYDDEATVVCFQEQRGQPGAFALDATSGKVLWQLPTQDRFTPPISTAWHGIVYAEAGDVPLMLDARTGEDRTGDLPDVPDLVNGYVGLFQADESDLEDEPPTTIRRTTG